MLFRIKMSYGYFFLSLVVFINLSASQLHDPASQHYNRAESHVFFAADDYANSPNKAIEFPYMGFMVMK